ncbi:hypothetical protein Tco_1512015 [Tanacetum coccineum]
MTYTTSTTKTKAAKYGLPSIKDIVPNIWSLVKVAYDRYALWAVTHVKVMRKYGYGYLEEIVVRRVDNILYRFKEVEDLQLRVESYQKKINVTKPDTTKPDLRKRHPYTPYKYPQGFIYVDDYKRNRLMHSDELYKFSDGTLTRLLSSLEDISKNIDMEYLPKRRWSNLKKKRAHLKMKRAHFSDGTLTRLLSLLEDISKNIDIEYLPKRRWSNLKKKRAHFMIKDINKLLKERRMMRSLEKFVGGRLYRTDLRLLQRTI